MLKRPVCQESLSDKIYRFRGTLLVISIPLLLITFVLYVTPSSSSYESVGDYALVSQKMSLDKKSSSSYAIIFDAGSSGSRVHVFHFYQNLDLVHMANISSFSNKSNKIFLIYIYIYMHLFIVLVCVLQIKPG